MGNKSQQLSLGIIEQMDAASKRGNAEANLQWNLKYHPRSEDEDRYVPKEVRMARHVNRLECGERCKLGPQDHTEEWKWPQPVCLKDVRRLEKRLGHQLEGAWVGCLVPSSHPLNLS